MDRFWNDLCSSWIYQIFSKFPTTIRCWFRCLFRSWFRSCCWFRCLFCSVSGTTMLFVPISGPNAIFGSMRGSSSSLTFSPRRWGWSCSLNVTSLDTKNLFDGGWKHLYPFCVVEYPKNTHLTALGSNFPLSLLWTCTKDTHPNILGWSLFVGFRCCLLYTSPSPRD